MFGVLGSNFGGSFKKPFVDSHNSAAGDAAKQLQMTKLDQAATQHALYSMRQAALAIVLLLVDAVIEEELGEQLPSEFLDAQMNETIGDMDDEPTAAEWLKNMLAAHIADALESLGASEDLIADAFGAEVDVADSALETIAETVMANLPADGDEINAWAKEFIYGDADDLEDSHNAVGKKPLTAGKTTTKKDAKGNTLRYKAVKVIRDGKPTVVNKRISGKPFLSPAKRAALVKAGNKAHTGTAIRKAQKSLGIGAKMGLYKNAQGLMKMHGGKLSAISRSKSF